MSKVIVISGASSGIGKAAAEYFQNQGNKVIGLSRSYPKDNYTYDYVLCDLGDPVSVAKAVEEISKIANYIDVLVNCAGLIKQRKNIKTSDFIKINSLLPHMMSDVCFEKNIKMIPVLGIKGVIIM